MNQQFLAPLILAFATLISAPDCHAIRYLQDNSTGGDCTLVGAWDDAGKTCTLNQDIADTIQINSSNTVLDCNGHQITHGPTSSYAGVNLAWVAGLTDIAVKNCDISGFIIGIDIWPAGGISGFKAISNNVHDNEYGIYVGNSSTALISDNTINDSEFGLYIRNSSTGLISDNTINGIRGIYLFASLEMEVSGNSIDGDGTALGFPWGVGIRISHGSNNNVIINNYVFDLAGPIENNGDNNFVSGNTVDTGGWGIGSQGNFNQIVNNDITGQHWASVMVVGSDNLVASNYVHESSRVQVFTYPVSVALAHRNIVENNIIENGLACKAPCGGTFGYETEAGIVLSIGSLIK